MNILQTTFLNAFLEWKYMNFDKYFTEVCPKGDQITYSSIGQWQAIIWTNDGRFIGTYLRHSAPTTHVAYFIINACVYFLYVQFKFKFKLFFSKRIQMKLQQFNNTLNTYKYQWERDHKKAILISLLNSGELKYTQKKERTIYET